jgi:hypothetical protein
MKKLGEKWYFTCDTCGIVEAAFNALECPRCKDKLTKRRLIEVYSNEGAVDDEEEAKAKCMSVCVNGSRTCNCRCQGRCHGAGKCYC